MAKLPVNHFMHVERLPTGETQAEIHAYPLYYQDGAEWKPIDKRIVPSQDPGWDFEVKKGVYKLRVKNNGRFEIDHLDDKFEFHIKGIGFVNTLTREEVLIQKVNLKDPILEESAISWNLPFGSVYILEYGENYFRDVVKTSEALLGYIKNHLPQGWAFEDTNVAVIYDSDFSNCRMLDDKNMATAGHIEFKKDGRCKHRILAGHAVHSKRDKTWRRKRFIKNNKFFDTAHASALDDVDGDITFNVSVTFQEGVSSYAGCTDTKIDQDAPTTNYETSTLECPYAFSTHARRNLIKFDLTSITGPVTVSSATFEFRIKSGLSGDGCTTHARRLLRDWVESQATWNEYATGLSWTTAGAQDTTNDIGASDIGSSSGTGITSPVTITMTGFETAVQNWINGTWSNQGFVFYSNAEGDATGVVGSSEDSTSTNRPKLLVTYTASSSSSSSSCSSSSSRSSSSSCSSSSSSSSRFSSSSSSCSSRSSSSSCSSSCRSSSSSCSSCSSCSSSSSFSSSSCSSSSSRSSSSSSSSSKSTSSSSSSRNHTFSSSSSCSRSSSSSSRARAWNDRGENLPA